MKVSDYKYATQYILYVGKHFKKERKKERKKEKMNRIKKILVFTIIILAFQSCKIVSGLIELNRKNAEVHSYNLADKDIKFISMHHMGKKEFYDDVTNIIKEYKSKGYVVYYELISTDFTKDTELKNTIRRKVRKLKGFSGTYKENAPDGFAEKYISQPKYTDLGTDSTDIRADVNYLELINEWEKQNGIIELDSLDLNTPFTEKFNKRINYTKKQYNAIFIEYRNKHLINLIKNSSSNKILVIYGKGHRKNFKKQLKQLNKLTK